MVFEAVVVDLLNKFLKQYVENLDTSQLKIGIWGGDVVLNDLKLKTTIFDDLDLPVRVKWGKLGKFAMKIPWKNLYTNQAVICIEELLVIIVPSTEMVYDAVKEEKWALEKKQAKLRAVEEAKKRDIESDAAKPKDSFLEKLISQVIKNLQVVIRNIHIRYEDKVTIPGSPFSVGVTMSNLSVETSIDEPVGAFPRLTQDCGNFICKVITLEGLAIYWNSGSVLFNELPEDNLSPSLIESIPTVDFKPENFKYVFGPLSAAAFLRLNAKPEIDNSNFTIPKIFVNVHLKEIDLAVTHHQFCDAMTFLQDYQRISAAAKYKKYRPVGVPVSGHAKEWWNFAYNAVAEDIVRHKNEWRWENIKEHRKLCRRYLELFRTKLNSKKLSVDCGKELAELEKQLNVFNLVLIREQVYVEVERMSKDSMKKKDSKSGSWFSGWFGYGADPKADSNEDELVKKIESVMTAQEKQKLYKAIGYEESAPPTNYPTTFVEFRFWFHLDEIKMTVYDDRMTPSVPVMTASIKSVRMEVEQRPSAFATKFVMIVGKFQVTGKQEKDLTYPELVASTCKDSESLIEFLFETKPLNMNCDQLINVSARPLKIIFHAETINFLRDVFTSEAPEKMEKIVAATAASLPTFQKITSLGLQYAIEKRAVLQLKVNIMSSCLIIPYGGVYHPDKEMLVIMLGELAVETEETPQKSYNVKQLHLEGTTDEEIFSAVLSASYTKFKCHLTGVQILFQLSGEDWIAASVTQRPSPMRFLESTNLEVTIKKSLVLDDARIPKMIVEGKLPSLAFNFSEERFVSFVALACSIPTKAEKTAPISRKAVSASAWSLQSLGTQLETKLIHLQKDFSLPKPTEYVQGIDLVSHFEMNELLVTVSKTPGSSKGNTKVRDSKTSCSEEHFLFLRIVNMEMEFTGKTFEAIQSFKLGKVDFKQYHKKVLIPFVSTKELREDNYLFAAEFINVDTKVPDFYTAKGAIINRLTLIIAPINVVLNKEALLEQLHFVANIQRRVDSVRESSMCGRVADAGKLKDAIYEEGGETLGDKKVITRGKRFRAKRSQKEAINFFLEACLDEIDITVEFEGQGLAKFSMLGASIALSTRKSYMNVDLNIMEISLLDLNPLTYHKKILASLEKQTLSSKVTLYNKEYFGTENSVDTSIEAEVGGLQCTLVTAFSNRAFQFLNAFQHQINTLKEGATVAAQKATENVIKAYQNAAQICLNIKINAPLLLIPSSTVGMEILAFDLGKLTIKNAITELDHVPEGETVGRPLIDVMKLSLHDLRIYRCILDTDSMDCETEINFLVPVSFELTLKRNLSRGWFRIIPELEVVARLARVHVTLSHDDLCAVLNIFQTNFKEGILLSGAKKAIPDVKSESKVFQKMKKVQSVFIHPDADDVQESEKEEESADFYTAVRFMFFMDSFVFDALTTNNPQSEELENSGLAKFVLEAMSLKGRLFSDGSIYTAVMLESCLLDDTRPGKKDRMTRFLEKTVDLNEADTESNSVNSMIEVIYQKKEEDYFIDCRVYKFTLILSMDFLQKLGVFFTLEEQFSTDGDVRQSTVDKGLPVAQFMDEGERPPTFTINLRLEKPDIVFVENMDSINADALIFHTEMILKYRIAGSRQVISGTLSDIELYSCCFNPSKRPHTLSQVIKPFTISAAGSTPEGSGLHVDVCLTEIVIAINPSTVGLISKCCEALLRDATSSQNDAGEEDYSDLWDVKPFQPEDYWFLKAELGMDALLSMDSISSLSKSEGSITDQICLLAIPSIKILLEEAAVYRPEPLLLLDMGFRMQCYNWSSKMTANSVLTVEMQYYNKTLSAWEPIIEPVECYSEQEKRHLYKPWELNFSVIQGDEGEIDGLAPPKWEITLSCTEILQLTLTKTSLEVIKNALDTYSTAVTKHYVKKLTETPPFIVKNETGVMAELLLAESKLELCKSLNSEYSTVKLESNSEVELQHVESEVSNLVHRCEGMSRCKKDTLLFVKFPIAGANVFELPLGLACKRYYPFPLEEFKKDEVWGLVTDISVANNTTTIFLRSRLRIFNYFNEPINIHALSEDGKIAEYVGTVEGNSMFSLPFHAVYSASKRFFFSVNGYSLSEQPFVWEDLKKELNVSVLLQCTSKYPENQDPFFIQAVGETEQIYHRNTNRKTMASMIYKIHLQPCVKIFNSLSVPLVICFQGSMQEKLLHPGNTIQISNAEAGKTTVTLRISDYLEKEWSCKERLLENPSEFLIWKFVSYNGLAPETLNLGVHVTYKKKIAVYTIYCPYIMVNKTEHLLAYKFDQSSVVFYHPGNFNSPVMFSPTSKKFFSKKSASLQVEQSSWSDKFPVDAAGSGGTVECKNSATETVYKISVTVSLTSNGLTKIVVFTPFLVFINSLNYTVECQESDFPQDPWLEIPPQSCTPFWPRSHSSKRAIILRSKGSEATTPPFRYDSTDNCLLRLSNKYGGIFVIVKATQSGTYITLNTYEPGLAPALIINHSAKVIKFHENDTKFSTTLNPLEQVMHSWGRPTGDRKIVVMNPKHLKDYLVLDRDYEGLVFTSKGEKARYVSFLDGAQRVILFTDDCSISKSISHAKAASSGVELICKVHGVGFSLVNNLTRIEIMYMGFVSSGISWENRKMGKTRFKKMKEDDINALEEAYDKYLDEKDMVTESDVNPVCEINENFKVDFEKMEMILPTVRELRRTFEPGFWMAYRLIEKQVMLHVKINKVQVDSQLHECIFPVVLSPVPPPKTVSTNFKGPRPFIELCVVKIAADRSGVEQYKYFKVLIQEFQVKLDIAFIQKMYQFFSAEEITDEEQKANFKKDIEFMGQPLISHVEIVSSNEQKNFFDLLHFPPFKIHFSFSLAGKIEMESLPPSFSVMLQSLGVTLTDVHDVVFRLSYFERKGAFFTKSELMNEVTSHYYGQMVRQAYVLLLGLDVIGNPYGLIVGIGEGVEAFFYEPFQGMIQGPSEFGAGMAIGCKSLFGHTVGSAAGTLGRLTETLGKGLAVLSLDKEYQLQRMEDRNRHDNIQASMARGGRGLVMGVYEGVTGVVRKPLRGAKEEGVGGFFKGIGKGMMGLVTRPVTGVVDFASTSLNAVRRATENSFGTKRMRPPRFFRDDSLVGPYNLKDAQGNAIFYSICKRKYCSTDKYEYHLPLREKEIVILTNRRIILAELSEVFGTWQEHMAITWRSMPDRPHSHTKGVAITMPRRNDDPKKDKPDVKVLLIEDAHEREEIRKKMVELYNLEKQYTEYQRCPTENRTSFKL